MNKKPNPEVPDKDNPEWTETMFREATTLEHSDLPADFKRVARRGRPKAKAPKQAISIRLSPDVVAAFRSMGRGWQGRIDEALKDWLEHHRAA